VRCGSSGAQETNAPNFRPTGAEDLANLPRALPLDCRLAPVIWKRAKR
jgi:hypothetical protein